MKKETKEKLAIIQAIAATNGIKVVVVGDTPSDKQLLKDKPLSSIANCLQPFIYKVSDYKVREKTHVKKSKTGSKYF
jgi:2-keto-3-deoxy-L-rhamnonate aldolase RhmA